ncbi:hypothetical protein [Pseudomonas sp. RL_5y_Pfl2_73]|uniref:hypothetical protein n=1 Tax=Pseudomonas sp. RL_5y_Pfl2_73 TaxID=3088713 RepID=UPI0030D7A5DF
MKERPILFGGPMVRAILGGQKTVTRRAVKFPLKDKATGCWLAGNEIGPVEVRDNSPFGQPGDRLYVRETFMDLRGAGVEHRPDPDGPLQRYAYGADTRPGSHGDEARKDFGLKWKPSIHMPRAACRILLEITDVRVERLQDISDGQAEAEGIDLDQLADAQERYDMVADHNMTGRPTAVGQFAYLWESINGAGAWDANPWVWVVEFKRVMP